MSGSTAFAMIDATEPETPIWNELLEKYRPRLVKAGVLYTPSVEVEQPAPPTAGDPDQQQPEPGQPVEPQRVPDPEQLPDPEQPEQPERPEQTPDPDSDPPAGGTVAVLSRPRARPGRAWQARAPW
jgi:outer membrane biosynthesis protein TonB